MKPDEEGSWMHHESDQKHTAEATKERLKKTSGLVSLQTSVLFKTSVEKLEYGVAKQQETKRI